MNHKIIGNKAEDMAAAEMKKRGCLILKRNYRCPLGEVDLIYLDGEVLVFAEVKYRSNLKKGWPEEAVDIKKQRRIKRCAKWFLMEEYSFMDIACRFDVISILGTQLKVYEHAFE